MTNLDLPVWADYPDPNSLVNKSKMDKMNEALMSVETAVNVKGNPGGAKGDGSPGDAAKIRAKMITAGIMGNNLFFPPGAYGYDDDTILQLLSNVSMIGVPGASILDFSVRPSFANGSDSGSNAMFIQGKGALSGNKCFLTKHAKAPTYIPPVTVATPNGIVRSGTTYTVTTDIPHGLVVGDYVWIRGGGSETFPKSGQDPFFTETVAGVAADPVQVLTVADSTHFTYSMPAPTAYSITGTQSDNLIHTVPNVFGSLNGTNCKVKLTGLAGGAGLVEGGTYYLKAPITRSAGTFSLSLTAGGAVVDFTTDLLAGTLTPLYDDVLTGVAHIAHHGKIIVHDGAQTFAADDMVVINSEDDRHDAGSEVIRLGEVNHVERVLSSTVLLVQKPVQDDYLAGGTSLSYIQKVAPIENSHVLGLTLIGHGTNLDGVNVGDKGIRWEYSRNCSVRNCTTRDIDLVTCEFRTHMNCKFMDNDVWFDNQSISGRVTGRHYVQYGCSLANGTEDMVISGNTFHNSRHGIVQASTGAIPGVSRNIRMVDNYFLGCWLGAISTHQGFEGGIITGNHIIGAVVGINVRYARGTQITDNHIWGGEQGIAISKVARSCQVKNNYIEGAWIGITYGSPPEELDAFGGLDVTGNQIFSCEIGIEFNVTLAGVFMTVMKIDNNTIHNCAGSGISIIGGDSTGKTITGTAADDTLHCVAHGWANGKEIVLSNLVGGQGTTLFNGLRARPYYVVNASADAFQVSLTVGGAAVAFSTDLTAGTACGDGFSGSVSRNILEEVVETDAGNHGIRATNAFRVHFLDNIIKSTSGLMSRGIYIDGAGTTDCLERMNTIVGNTSLTVQFATGTGHQTELERKEGIVLDADGTANMRFSNQYATATLDTFAAAGSDDMTNLVPPWNAKDGMEVTFKLASSAHQVTVKHQGPGNIWIAGATNFLMDSTRDRIKMAWDEGTLSWYVLTAVSI